MLIPFIMIILFDAPSLMTEFGYLINFYISFFGKLSAIIFISSPRSIAFFQIIHFSNLNFIFITINLRPSVFHHLSFATCIQPHFSNFFPFAITMAPIITATNNTLITSKGNIKPLSS